MSNKNDVRMRRSRKKGIRRSRKRRMRRSLIIFTIFLGLIISSGILKSTNLFKKDVVEATKVDKALSMIGENNPINTVLDEKKSELEEAKAKEAIEVKREEIRKVKFEEEKKKQEEYDRRRTEGTTDNNDKVAFLTFDDGPSVKVTPMILEILKEYDIKATFFVVGKMVDQNPEILKRTFEEGHAIANHSYSHDYDYIYGSASNFLNDFKKAENSIKGVIGNDYEGKIIRFPGGSFGEHKTPMKTAALNAGYEYIDWNALNGDAEGLNISRERLISRVKETTYNKNHVIILMHDTDAKENTALSLREVLDYLISQNYRFDVLK